MSEATQTYITLGNEKTVTTSTACSIISQKRTLICMPAGYILNTVRGKKLLETVDTTLSQGENVTKFPPNILR